jgi:hypothetical protein
LRPPRVDPYPVDLAVDRWDRNRVTLAEQQKSDRACCG